MKGTIIGIAGPTASGKTTVAKHVADMLGAHRAKYSDVLLDFAHSRRIEHTDKATLQAISNEVRAQFGNDILARELRKRLETVTTKHVVVEGNRLMDDMAFLEELARDEAKQLLLLYIDADADARFLRINGRLRGEGLPEIDRGTFDRLESDPCEEELPIVREFIRRHPNGHVIETSSRTVPEVLLDIDSILGIRVTA